MNNLISQRFILSLGKWGVFIYDTQKREALTLEETKTRLNEHFISNLDVEIKSGRFGAYFMVQNVELDLFAVVKILNSIKYNLTVNVLEGVVE